MTDQETFDFVVASVIRQGKRSTKNDQCQYRGPDGLKCAAGFLLPDNVYDSEWDMNGFTVNNGPVYDAIVALGHNPDLVEELQLAHDSGDDVDFVNYFYDTAISIVNRYNLSSKVLDAEYRKATQ